MSESVALSLALRIKADMGAALQEMQRLGTGVDGIGAAATRTTSALAKTSQALDQGQDRIKGMVQQSLEYQRTVQATIASENAAAEAARTAAVASAEQAAAIHEISRAAFESQAAVTAQINLIGELHNRVERGARSMEDLADTEAMLDRAVRAGLVSQEEQLEIFEALDRQEKELIATQQREEKQLQHLIKAYDPASAALRKITEDEAKLKQAVDEGRISREQYNRAMTGLTAQREQWEQISQGVDRASKSIGNMGVSARELRTSLSSALGAALRGDVAGAGRSITSLGARGAVSFGVLGGAAAFSALAVGALGLAALKGYEQSQELARGLIASGGAAGITAGQFEQMAASVNAATDRIGKGRAALLQLGQEGGASADTLEKAAAAAVAVSELTGATIEQTTGHVQKLMKEPAKYSAELNKQYNYLTAEVYNQIRALEQQGRQVDAVRLAIETFSASSVQRLNDVDAQLGWLEQAWNGVSGAAKWAWDAMLGIGRDDGVEGRLAKVQDELLRYETELRQIGGMDMDDPNVPEHYRARINELLQEELRLIDQVEAAQVEAATKATAAAEERAAIEAEGRQSAALGQDRALAKAAELKQLEADIAALRAKGITQVDGLGLDQLRAKRLAQIEEQFKERKTPRSDAQKELEAQQKFVEQLERQAAVYNLNEEELREYEIAERNLTGTLRDRALVASELLEVLRKQKEEEERLKKEHEEAKNAWEALRASLRTPVEAAVATAVSQIDDLNRALKEVGITEEEYQQALARIVGAGGPMPRLVMPWNDLVGLTEEQDALDAFARQLQQYYDARAQIIAEGRAKGQATEEFWRQQELMLEQQHSDQLLALQQARQQLMVDSAASIAGSLASIARSTAGEQSKAYQVLFAISKGFAVAQAAVALAQNVAEASKVGFPQNLPLIAGAFAQGAQIASILSSANYSGRGYAEGGYTGPGGRYEYAGDVHKGEGVLNQDEIRALGGPAGFYALRDLIASGMVQPMLGAPRMTAPVAPRFSFAEGGYASHAAPDIKNLMRLYLYQDIDQLRGAVLNHPSSEKWAVATIGENGRAVQAEW